MNVSDPRQSTQRRGMGAVARIISVMGLIALTTLGVGLTAVSGIRDVAKLTDRVASQDIQQLEQARSLQYEFMRVRFLSADATLQTDRRLKEGRLAERDRLMKDVITHAEQMRDTPGLSESEHARAAEVATRLSTCSTTLGQLTQLYGQGRTAQANALQTKELAPNATAIRTSLEEITRQRHERALAAAAQAASKGHRATTVTILVGVMGILAALGLGRLVGTRMARNLRSIEEAASAAARGDLSVRINSTRQDETGRAARALDQALDGLGELVRQITGVTDHIVASVTQLRGAAESVAGEAASAADGAQSISASAGEVSRNVATTAAGTEEMSVSIREIARNAQDAAQVAASAVDVANRTTATVAKLGDSSAEIGNVVKMITTIAGQTNLLALNATIEAARAGEAGKGFAVVASEVKDLAQETSRATEDIGRRVQAIQVDTEAAVTAIKEISNIIDRINDTQTTIAGAVEEQTATTNEMGRNVSDAAQGSSHIAQSLDIIVSTANSSNRTMQNMTSSIDDLAATTQELRARVQTFVI